MLISQFRKYNKCLPFFIFCLLVQFVFPVGFMPALGASDDGLIKICPHQQPELFALVAMQNGQYADHSEEDYGHFFTRFECDWGASLISCYLLRANVGLEMTYQNTIFLENIQSLFFPTVQFHFRLIRGPPTDNTLVS